MAADNVPLGSLTLNISANATSAATSIGKLSKSLEGLGVAVSSSGLATATTQMQGFAAALNSVSISEGAYQQIRSAATAIKNATAALKGLEKLDIGNAGKSLSAVSKALSSLSSVEKASGFTTTVNALKKLPDVAKSLETVDMGAFAAKIQEVSVALEPLASQMDRVSSGFAAFPAKLNAVTAASQRTSAGVGGLALMFRRLLSYAVVRRIATGLGNLIKKSTEYVEDLNLFTVAMGGYADQAQKYAETVSEVMGIDVAQWLRAQGVFQTLATGFGVSADRAAIMSKNLTQLAYDLSSFYNLDVDKAMQKLESGFAGEIEPVRRLGYDLSKTTLQATAASLGITKLFADMTQAEKSQLRYYALMTQVTQVQGDMARTLSAPANQLRILTAQIEMTKRALGNIFIPALNAVLPYLIAFAKFVRLVADEIARFFGYTLPEIDYSGISVGIGDVEDSVDDLGGSLGRASGRAKELKGLLASFDQLNIIQSETGGGSGYSGGGISGVGSSGWRDFELPEYDFLKNALTSRADEIFAKMRRALEKWKPVLRWIRDHLSQIFDIVKAIGLGLLGWKLSSSVANLFGKTLTPAAGLGIGLMIGGFSLEFSGARNIGAGKAELWDYINTALGAALGIGGSLLLFGTGPAGWLIGIGAALLVTIVGVTIGENERTRQTIADSIANLFTGAVDSVDYGEIVAQRFANFGTQFAAGLDIASNLQSGKNALQTTASEIDNYILKISGVGSLTETEVEQMNAALSRLVTEGAQYISETYDLLKNGLLHSLNILPDEAAEAVKGYLSALSGLESDEERQLNEMRSRLETALNNAMQPGISEDTRTEYLQQATELHNLIGMLTGAYTTAVADFETAKSKYTLGLTADDINFADVNKIQEYFDGVKQAFDEAKQQVEEYWNAEITAASEKLQYYTAIGDTNAMQYWENVLASFQLGKRTDIGQLEAMFDRETLPILEKIRDHRDEVIQSTFEKEGPNWLEYIAAGNGPNADATAAGLALKRITQEIDNAYLIPLSNYIIENGTTEVANAVSAMVDDGFKSPLDSYTYQLVDLAAKAGTRIGNAFGDNATNTVAAQTNSVGRRLKKWWECIRPTSGVAGDPFSWGTMTIQPFATGGMPRAGSLFLAGEGGGAELVGSMGNQTAVANGGQIIAGIAYGVAQANAEEARLLREQNSLLRQIAATGGQVVFPVGPEAGRAIQFSLDAYATQRGY